MWGRKKAAPPGSETALAVVQPPRDEPSSSKDDDAMLDLKRPKHVVNGAVDGLKCVTAGVVGGAVSLVAMPVIGARENGVKGFATGLAKGVAGAVVLPAAGAGAGVTQLIRGAIATPAAAQGMLSGKQWNSESRKWRHYSLPEDLKEFEEAEKQMQKVLEEKKKRTKEKEDAEVADTTYYEALGVSSTATNAEIKRAYLKRARELHPDKNPDNPEAKALFQKLGEAYQVLSNEESRARYDARGMQGLTQEQFMDASTIYSVLFGSEDFEEYVGELQLASMLALFAASDGKDVSYKYLNHKQLGREVRCALKLVEILNPYIDDSPENFEAAARAKAENLAQTSFGELLLNTIGKVYVAKAGAALNHNPMGAASHYLKQKRHVWSTHLKMAQSVVKMYNAGREVQRQAQKEQQEKIKEQTKTEQRRNDSKASAPASAGASASETGEAGSSKTGAGAGGKRPSFFGRAGKPKAEQAKSEKEVEGEDKEEEEDDEAVGKDAIGDDETGTKECNHTSGDDKAGTEGDQGQMEEKGQEAKDQDEGREESKDLEDKGKKEKKAKEEKKGREDKKGKEKGKESTKEEDMDNMPMPQPKDLATFMEGAWYLSVIDVESTLRHVCKKVLTDTSVDKERRTARARALLVLGRIFASTQSPATKAGGQKTLREQLEAFVSPMAAAATADFDSDEDEDLDQQNGEDQGASSTPSLPQEADLQKMPVKDLKALCGALGVDTAGLAEKGDLVAALVAAIASGEAK